MANIFSVILYLLFIFGIPLLISNACRLPQVPRRRLVFLAIVLCSLLAAFRESTGTDSAMYIRAYLTGNIDRWVDFEPGYIFISTIFRALHMPYQVLLFAMSFGTNFFVFYAIQHEMKNINVYLASFIYMIDLFFLSMNIMRQALAIAICLYAIILYKDNRKLAAAIFIAAATLFHYSAFICYGIFLAKYFFENRNAKIWMIVIFSVLFILVNNRNFFAKIVVLLTHNTYYAGYVTRYENPGTNLIRWASKHLPALIVLFLNYRNYRKIKGYTFLFGCTICGYILASLATQTHTAVDRLALYFMYLNIFTLGVCGKEKTYLKKETYATPSIITEEKRFLPGVITVEKYISPRSMTVLLCIYYLLFFSYATVYMGYSEMIPYGRPL